MSPLAVFFRMIIAPALAILLALLRPETLDGNLLGWFLLVLGIAYPAGGVIYYFIPMNDSGTQNMGRRFSGRKKGIVRSGSSCQDSWSFSSPRRLSGCSCWLFFHAFPGCRSPG